MVAHPSPIKFTYEDYLLFPDDGKRHELIEGEHYVTPSPVTRHQRIVLNLGGFLNERLRNKQVGQVFVAPVDVMLSDRDVVQPDVLFLSPGRETLITDACIKGAPDLCVEVISDSTRKTDEIVKRKLYERFGVLEYWIIDPELETVKVYRLAEGRYTRTAELTRENHDTLTTPLLPGLSILLDTLFA
ncbi:MAG: Uma2 family endonuclease [Nitrospirota bacterium]